MANLHREVEERRDRGDRCDEFADAPQGLHGCTAGEVRRMLGQHGAQRVYGIFVADLAEPTRRTDRHIQIPVAQRNDQAGHGILVFLFAYLSKELHPCTPILITVREHGTKIRQNRA